MALAWFVCGYWRDWSIVPTRYCAMDEFTQQIHAENGTWSETEVLGGYALVKVRASETLLSTIAGTEGFLRIPRVWRLDDPLSTLSTAQRSAVKARLNAMGYTDTEISAALKTLTLSDVTLGQVLRFAASRRRKPRYDAVQDQIVLDGAYQPCRPVADADADVTE